MRKTITCGLLFAAGLLTTVASASAQAQTVMTAATPRPERALELERKAEQLHARPAQYLKAARLHMQAAELRAADDPLKVRNLEVASRLFHFKGRNAEALDAMERAASSALAAGDVVSAAHSFIDASHLAVANGRRDDVVRFAERARLLTRSPMLSEADRSRITARLQPAFS